MAEYLTREEVEERLATIERLLTRDDVWEATKRKLRRERDALFTCEQLAEWLRSICPQVEYFNPDTLPSDFRPVVEASAWLEGRS